MSTAAPVAASAVRAQSLSRVIEDRRILNELTFEIPHGSYVALLGANGAGKTTLLKIIATLLMPSGGTLELFSNRVTRDSAGDLRARLGLIGHAPMLYRDLTAMENLKFFGRLYGVADASQRASQLLDSFGLLPRKDGAVKTFSRGMAQRVSIARALMHDPDLLLADEPFAGLDAPSAKVVEDTLESLHARGKTIILANHDIPQSLRLARRVLVLRRGRLVHDAQAMNITAPSILAEMTRA